MDRPSSSASTSADRSASWFLAEQDGRRLGPVARDHRLDREVLHQEQSGSDRDEQFGRRVMPLGGQGERLPGTPGSDAIGRQDRHQGHPDLRPQHAGVGGFGSVEDVLETDPVTHWRGLALDRGHIGVGPVESSKGHPQVGRRGGQQLDTIHLPGAEVGNLRLDRIGYFCHQHLLEVIQVFDHLSGCSRMGVRSSSGWIPPTRTVGRGRRGCRRRKVGHGRVQEAGGTCGESWR